MLNTFDISELLYKTLVQGGVLDIINGGIYHQGQRPENSTKEDVIINIISMTTDSTPQAAVGNVNIYVPDKMIGVKGSARLYPNTKRLNTIAKAIDGIIRASIVDGVGICPTNQTLIPESSINQHYVNIRVSFNIQKV